MGFLSNLARQIKNKDDDEAMDIIRRRSGMSLVPPPTETPVALPPPARNVIPMMGQPAAPGAPLPPPSRTPVSISEPPPPLDPYGLNTMEKLAAESRDTMAQADYSNATMGPNGEMADIRFPMRAAPIPPPTRTSVTPEGTPEPVASGAYVPPPMRDVMEESYKGMTPTQRARLRLQTLQSAAPESKVRDTGAGYTVGPPQRTSRLKAAGKGFLQLLAAGAPFGIGGMGGAGIVGAIQGAVNPGAVQKRGREMEIAGAEGDLARAQTLEAQGIQNETRRVQNMSQIAGLQNDELDRQLAEDKELRVEWQQGLNNIGDLQKRQEQLDPASAEYAAAEKAIKDEAARLSKRTGRSVTVIPGNPKLNKLPYIRVDGEVLQPQRDGSLKKVYGSSKSLTEDMNADQKSDYEWQAKNAENKAKRTASMQEAAALEATAADLQNKVTAAGQQLATLDAEMSKIAPTIPGVGPNPQYQTLKNMRDQAERIMHDSQQKMDAAYKQASEKKAEAAKYPELPAPPKRARRGGTGNNLTIEGAIQRFKEVRKREPTAQEIANMQAALPK